MTRTAVHPQKGLSAGIIVKCGVIVFVASFFLGALLMQYIQNYFAQSPNPMSQAAKIPPVALPEDEQSEEEQERQEEEIEDLEDLRSRSLKFPVSGQDLGDTRDSFSDQRSGHRHEAIDILAPMKTPVLAVEDGKIAKLWFSKYGGVTIYQFDPDEKYAYYYAHLDSYVWNLSEGDEVEKGQIIGYVGTSGNAPPNTPHLHFAIFKLNDDKNWWEGKPINPYDIFKP